MVTIAATPPTVSESSGTPSKVDHYLTSNSIYVTFGSFCNQVEVKILNPYGYIPVLGSITSLVRATIGIAQYALGTIGHTFHSLSASFTSDREKSLHRHQLAGYCYELMIHSLANSTRACFEIIPLLPLVTTLPYDMTGLRYRYQTAD